MPFLTYDPLPQCLQQSPLTPLLLARGHQRGSRRYLSDVKCLSVVCSLADNAYGTSPDALPGNLLRAVPATSGSPQRSVACSRQADARRGEPWLAESAVTFSDK